MVNVVWKSHESKIFIKIVGNNVHFLIQALFPPHQPDGFQWFLCSKILLFSFLRGATIFPIFYHADKECQNSDDNGAIFHAYLSKALSFSSDNRLAIKLKLPCIV